VLLVFKINVPVEKCGNLWNFVGSPAISDVFYCILCTVLPPVSADSVSAVYHSPKKKNWKIKEINGS
jgi:hypothetical protein